MVAKICHFADEFRAWVEVFEDDFFGEQKDEEFFKLFRVELAEQTHKRGGLPDDLGSKV